MSTTLATPVLSLIAAVARNRAIGLNGRLLWHLPEDMQYFRTTTRGKPVIMGRKTWESLPDAFRPLPGRLNIVLSRNPDYAAAGATRVTTLPQAITVAGVADEVFVIGGAELYRQALPLAQRLYLTEVDSDSPGDAYFPEFDAAQWQETGRRAGTGHEGPAYAFVTYTRR